MLLLPANAPEEDKMFIAEVYIEYKALLYSTALHYTKGDIDAEDIVQDAVVRLMSNTKTLRTLKPAALMTYLTLAVRSAALNQLRHQKVMDEHTSELTVEQADAQISFRLYGEGLDGYVLRGEREDKLSRALQRLPERDQLLLMGKYYLQLDNRELQKMIGCQLDSVRMLLTRARWALTEELKKEGIFHGRAGAEIV